MKRRLKSMVFGIAGLASLAAAPAMAQEVQAFPSIGQRASAEVAVPLRVEAGQQYLLTGRIETTTAGLGNDGAYAITYTMVLDVEQADRTGGIWRWSFEDIGIEAFEAPGMPLDLSDDNLNELISAAARLTTDIDFVCRVDTTGACVELLNWPDWRERVENLTLIVSGGLGFAVSMQAARTSGPEEKPPPGTAPRRSANPDPAAIASVVRGVAGLLLDGIDNRTAATMMAMPMITGLQGQSLRAGVATPVETLLPLPYGAQPLRYTGTLTLESIDRRAGEATFSRTATLDEAALKASLNAIVANLAPQVMEIAAPLIPRDADGNSPAVTEQFTTGMVNEALAAFTFDYRETTRGTVDLATGLVRQGESTVTFKLVTPDGQSLGESTSRMTFGFAPGVPPRPRLGASAPQPQ